MGCIHLKIHLRPFLSRIHSTRNESISISCQKQQQQQILQNWNISNIMPHPSTHPTSLCSGSFLSCSIFFLRTFQACEGDVRARYRRSYVLLRWFATHHDAMCHGIETRIHRLRHMGIHERVARRDGRTSSRDEELVIDVPSFPFSSNIFSVSSSFELRSLPCLGIRAPSARASEEETLFLFRKRFLLLRFDMDEANSTRHEQG